MPKTVWIRIAAIVAVVVAALAAVIILVPDPRVADGAAPRDAAPNGSLPAAPPGDSERGAAVEPVEARPPPTIDPELAEALRSYAAAPTYVPPSAASQAVLETAVADGPALTLDFRINLVRATYATPSEVELIPGLVAFPCNDQLCFEFRPNFPRAPCSDPTLASLLSRGAAITFRYSDEVGEAIHLLTVDQSHCDYLE